MDKFGYRIVFKPSANFAVWSHVVYDDFREASFRFRQQAHKAIMDDYPSENFPILKLVKL